VAGVTGSDLEQRIERIMTNDVRDRLTAWKRLLLATAGAIAIAAPIAIGALTAPRLAAQSSSADAGQLAFATASVTPSATGDSGFYPLVMTDGRFTAKNATLSALIRNLYPIPGFRMQGAPSWLNTEHFDFDARAEGNPTKEQMRAMVRTLLADRFKLIVHNETQQLPVYELVLITRDGTPGPQLRPSSPECVAAADAMHAGAAPMLPNGQRAVLAGPPLPAGVPCGGVNSRRDTFTARAATMEEVARGGFAPLLGQLVVNKTGLTGHFDADMTFTPAAEPPPPARAGGYGRAAPFIGPSFFAAVEEQLGLKLNPQTGPVDVLIIDRVERPTP
jgi:uncharacterized protein (TIGR03435 family)